MDEKQLINTLSAKIFPEIVEIRHDLHRNPELSGEEMNSAALIASVLKKWDIPYQSGMAGNGIVAMIEGNTPGRCIALRADMDALPIQEEFESNYKSLVPGVMHACGHDAHVASLLGTAFILKNMKDRFNGSFKLLFQPSEENFPGGAIMMIKEGALENPAVDAIIGQHVLPQLEMGCIGLKSGKYMASTDEIYLTVLGKGGHGATPELNIDPVVVASHIVVALQQISSRFANPSTPTVLSFGRMIADGRTNIIPDKVTIEGTMRTFDEAWRDRMHNLIRKIASGTAESFGASCNVDIHHGYPFLVNDDECTELARKAASDFLGGQHVVDLPLRMTSEDFAYFSQKIPGIYYRLGIKNQATDNPECNLHSGMFNMDDEALKTGSSVMARIALDILSAYNKKHSS